MIPRAVDADRLQAALGRSPVVVLTGPRQAGKSTLARQVVGPARSHMFDLEDPRDLARLAEPTLTLGGLGTTVVIDEAQRLPGLFPILRVLVDEDLRPGRFLVLGSASPDLVGLASESLAGRVTLLELPGLRAGDVGPEAIDQLWERGALPPSFTAADDAHSNAWRDDYIRTFLERDLALLGVRTPAATMRRFWMMLAHYHGQTWNGAELARAMAVSQPTIRHYLDALTDALIVRQLQPWHANISKRQVRSPKVYLRDSGLLHRLLGIPDRTTLDGHPKIGASWEGFVIEQLLAARNVSDAWFWGTHNGAELDLLTVNEGQRTGFEIKRTDQPKLSASMHRAIEDLELDRLIAVHAGTERFFLAERIEAVPVVELLTGPHPAPLWECR